MADYITIDGGTTNTRISLVSDFNVIDTIKINAGARKGIENNSLLKDLIGKSIQRILQRNNKNTRDIERILASGMITSEFGLLNLEHITVPAGLKELSESMFETVLEDVCKEIPFVFIRGVKTECNTLENADMMRGEETELMGISNGQEGVFVLPGSHSKIIKTDSMGRIVDFKTMLTGEMIAAIAENTILKASVNLKDSQCDEDYLLMGYDYALKNGINEALFKVRILKNIFSKSDSLVYSFFLGVILCDEIKYILDSKIDNITIAGKKQIKEATTILLKKLSDAKVTMLTDYEVDISSFIGLIKIYEFNS